MCPLTTRSSFWKCRYLRRSNIAQTVSTACRRPSPDMPRTCPYRLIHEEIEFKSQTFYDSLPRICPWPAHDLPITSPWPAQGPSATSPRRPPACSVAILAEASSRPSGLRGCSSLSVWGVYSVLLHSMAFQPQSERGER